MSGTLPNFVIIGAQKSGTTSLYSHLRAHPDVFCAQGKEIHYFDRHANESLDWYRSKFVNAAGEQVIGEATPDYMYFDDALSRMAKVLPRAKLIAILRNPVDRAYSHYWHEVERGREGLEFSDAIAAEPKRLETGDHHTIEHHSYIDRGRYLRQLQKVCELYSREALKVVLLEDLQNSPLETYSSICGFLGVDDSFTPADLGVAANQHVAIRSSKLRQVYRSPLLPSYLRKPVSRVVGRLNARKVSYPPLDAAVRADLVKLFAKDNAALGAWLGRDLSGWNR